MRAAMVETETREEVAQEMEERMQMMDKMYRERISRENEENDRKTDEKMDLLHRALKTGGTISPVKKNSRITEETMVEDDVLVRQRGDRNFSTDMFL
jgi:kinesin family member 20